MSRLVGTAAVRREANDVHAVRMRGNRSVQHGDGSTALAAAAPSTCCGQPGALLCPTHPTGAHHSLSRRLHTLLMISGHAVPAPDIHSGSVGVLVGLGGNGGSGCAGVCGVLQSRAQRGCIIPSVGPLHGDRTGATPCVPLPLPPCSGCLLNGTKRSNRRVTRLQAPGRCLHVSSPRPMLG